MKKFAAQVLSMTNQCNLRCTYCDWEKHPFHRLTEQDLQNAGDNIAALRTLLDSHFPSVQLIEYSGGEVTLYPELLDKMLDTFHDKWFRIVTNGTMLTDTLIQKLQKRGKVFIALSLDGNTLEANKTRFGSNLPQFQRVWEALDKLLQHEIPVMLLCTINSANISSFHEYMRYLEQKYRRYIEDGFLFVPAHYVFNYSGDNGMPTREQELKLVGYLETTNDLTVHNLHEHYMDLAYFIGNRKHFHECHIPEWCLPVHFRGNSMIEDGRFTSFGCGMRGKLDFGEFNIHQPGSFVSLVEAPNLLDDVKFMNGENCEDYCFVDWYLVDLILQGVIPIEKAQRWFMFFRDPAVIQYIEQNKLAKHIAHFTYQTCGTCSTTIKIGINTEDNTIESVQFVGGCQANLKGISTLVIGMKPEAVIGKLRGIDCQCKGTSCPDQLSKALEDYLRSKMFSHH